MSTRLDKSATLELSGISKLVEFSKSPSFFHLGQSPNGNLFVSADLESERWFADNMESLGFRSAGDALSNIQYEFGAVPEIKPYIKIGDGRDNLNEWHPKLEDMLRETTFHHEAVKPKRTIKMVQQKKAHIPSR